MLSEFSLEAQNRLHKSQKIRKIIKSSQFINQYAVSSPGSSKSENNKVVFGPCRVLMNFSYTLNGERLCSSQSYTNKGETLTG
jgi:hypothetical protein